MASILILGASGRTGLELIRKASAHDKSPTIHAFVRTKSKLPAAEAEKCASVQEGDSTKADDIKKALEATSANTVIMAIGHPNARPSDVREKSATALMEVIKPGTPFEHVRVAAVSSDGAGDTKIDIGFGMGKVLTFHLRHVLKDHTQQENALKAGLGDDEAQKKRLLIVRPTGLTVGNERGTVVLSGSTGGPSHVDRGDVAKWIIDEVCGEGRHFGQAVGLTHPPKK